MDIIQINGGEEASVRYTIKINGIEWASVRYIIQINECEGASVRKQFIFNNRSEGASIRHNSDYWASGT